MGYKIRINPVDLQDRNAFLTFLHGQAEKGYQAVRILPTHTYFKKSSPEDTYYTLTFDSGEAAKSDNLYAMNNGIMIYRVSSGKEDPAWCEKVLVNYGRFTQFRRSRLLGQILQIFPTLILMIPCIYLLNLFDAPDQFAEFTGMIGTMVAVLGGIGIFQVMQLAVHLLSWQVDNVHLKEMRKAAALGQPYHTPEALAAKVRIKNGLACYFYGLVLGVETVYLIFILLFIC